MAKMVEQLVSNFKIVGSSPTTLFEIVFSFFHSQIFSIHNVSPACGGWSLLKEFFIAVKLNLKGPPWCSVIPGFEPMPLLGPTLEIKLCMVYSWTEGS